MSRSQISAEAANIFETLVNSQDTLYDHLTNMAIALRDANANVNQLSQTALLREVELEVITTHFAQWVQLSYQRLSYENDINTQRQQILDSIVEVSRSQAAAIKGLQESQLKLSMTVQESLENVHKAIADMASHIRLTNATNKAPTGYRMVTPGETASPPESLVGDSKKTSKVPPIPNPNPSVGK